MWQVKDTQICQKAEASGMAINKETGNPITLDELDAFAQEYDKIRNQMSVDEFFKIKMTSKPFEF